MKLDQIKGTESITSFKGKRVWKNTVSQLTRNNPYSLTEPNQRYISNAINSLAKTEGSEKFLITTAKNLKYSTNIKLRDLPKNNWKALLLTAAASAAALSPLIKDSVDKKIKKVEKQTSLNSDEKAILEIRKQLLQKVDIKQIANETNGSIKEFERNLDYFIISTETTLEHKKYVLERLNYMMSDDYKINPQLKDKKSIVAAEMINDMAIHTPGNEIPNIKAVDQKRHGMCAAISIVRKKLAYEDKPNYVDSILSELDSSNYISVYDRTKLGSKKKTKVNKVPVDFDSALAKGYRIIDASALHWMQIADMGGASNIAFNEYHPFDKENFDVNADSFFNVKLKDPELGRVQAYYQALVKADNVIGNYKAGKIKNDVKDSEVRYRKNDDIQLLMKISEYIKQDIAEIAPNVKNFNGTITALLNLKKLESSKIAESDLYSYIPNEEDVVKKEKIGNFLKKELLIDDIAEYKLNSIFDNVEAYHEIADSQNVSHSKSAMIKDARRLYEVAAAYRNQVLISLNEQESLKDFMQSYKINNEEALLTETIDKIIDAVKKEPEGSTFILEQASSIFQNVQPEKEIVIDALEYMKQDINTKLTTELDEIYQSLMLSNRKEALIQYLESIKMGASIDKSMQLNFASLFNIKPNEVPEKIDSLIDKLNTANEKDYNEIFNSLGNTSQMEFLANFFKDFVEKLSEDGNDEFLYAFMETNGISKDAEGTAVTDKLEEIQEKINDLSKFFIRCSQLFKIQDAQGDVLISASPKDVLIKKFENKHSIVSSKKLEELREHFEKIDKERSTDEFRARQGKLKDKSLYNFSKSEKETLNEVKNGINEMYSYVHKELWRVQHEMKDSIEELKRIIGLNNGDYWVGEEGNSGLSGSMQIRILEYMTGRPHYNTENLERAIEKIKTGPYSGISTSSVYHNDFGMHAQYIADIAPVKIVSKDKNGKTVETTKEVLFNDNSWGAKEHENVWTDSYGLTRTDYSDNRGGTLGYITNDSFRNGNFVDRILKDMVLNVEPDGMENKVYKKIKKPMSEAYHSPQYSAILLDGKSPDIKKTVDMIHDTIFDSSLKNVEDIEEIVQKYSKDELSSMIKDYKGTGKNWKPVYRNLVQRIFPTIGKSFETEEEYNKLADDDYLKVVLEKVALLKRGQLAGLEPELAKIRNVKDLKKFKIAQKLRAINSFKYAFEKNSGFLDYLSDKWSDEDENRLKQIVDKYKLELSEEEYNRIGDKLRVDSDKFNGSAKDSINEILKNLQRDINSVVHDKNAQLEIRRLFRDFLSREMYFNEKDLKNPKIKHIIDFIDRVYNPNDDKEFVEIYRKIQNMTNEEFRKEVLSKVKPEDLGLKDISGYDILRKIQYYDEKTNTSFMNQVYYDITASERNSDEYNISYKYGKFTRSPLYRPVYNFNTLYAELSTSLSSLTLPKLFNKYKGANLSKYGVYPAYPKTGVLSEKVLQTSYDSLIEVFEENVASINSVTEQIESYDITHKLKNYDKKFDETSKLSDYQYKNINYLLGKLVTLNSGDSSLEKEVSFVEQALELPKDTPWGHYKVLLSPIIRRFTEFENCSPKSNLEEIIGKNRYGIEANKSAFLDAFIQKKYKSRVAEMLNKLEKAYIKNKDAEQIESMKEALYNEFVRCHLLQNPEELLQAFIKSGANDSESKTIHKTYYTLIKRSLNFAKLVEIEETLMDAIKNGVELNAKSLFDDYTVTIADKDFSMGSGDIIERMVNGLILDNQTDTALMFVEKLGLGESYVKQLHDNLDLDGIKEIFYKAYKISANFNQFNAEIVPYIEKMTSLLRDDDSKFLHIINKAKKDVKQLSKACSLEKDSLSVMFEALDNIKNACINNENTQKHLVFKTLFEQAVAEIAKSEQIKIDKLNEILQDNVTVINVVNQIMLPTASDAFKLRDEMNDKFNAILKYKENLEKNLQDS